MFCYTHVHTLYIVYDSISIMYRLQFIIIDYQSSQPICHESLCMGC